MPLKSLFLNSKIKSIFFKFEKCLYCQNYYGPNFEESLCLTCHCFVFPNVIEINESPNESSNNASNLSNIAQTSLPNNNIIAENIAASSALNTIETTSSSSNRTQQLIGSSLINIEVPNQNSNRNSNRTRNYFEVIFILVEYI